MARLLPDADPAAIELDPERRVAEALCDQLPNSCVIFHSYPWLRPERDLKRKGKKDVLREGEADFVVVHPRYGIVVIEVKGGQMVFDPELQRWGRKGATHQVKDPFDQAARNLRALEEQIQSRYFGGYPQLPFTRARCVVFPHCDYKGTLPPGAHGSIFFGAADLTDIGDKLEHLLKIQPFVPKEPLSRSVLDAITRGLTSTFQMVPALWAEIEDQEKRLFLLTEDQLNILKLLQDHPRAAVQGVAGSGKTILAMSKARTFADEGMHVLFVCFNELLASWLRSQLPEVYKNAVTVRNYHKLCSEWVQAAGMAWPMITDESEFFRSEAAQLLEQAIDFRQDLCFDAVVVDEGQDFQPAWWDTIELLNKRPMEGALYVFFDPDQQIFRETAGSMPDLGKPFVLPVNCRNTSRIAAHCGSILDKEIAVNHGAPKGRTPRVVHAGSGSEQVDAANAQVAEWTSKESGLRADQIAIITRGKASNSSLGGVREIGGLPVVDDLERWRSGAGILLTSLYRFKGLEADALIFVDVCKPAPSAPPYGFRSEHFYVGCSRAKHLLTIVETD